MMRIRQYRLRASAVVVTIATVLSAGTVGVKAIGPCQRFVTRVVQRAVPKHHISQATLAKWAAWSKAHPNYHPPKRKPRPAVSPKEIADKVNFACEVPTVDAEQGELVPPDTPGVLFPVEMATVDTGNPPIGPQISLVNVPNEPPPIGALPDVPEPAPAIYLLTAAVLLLFAKRFGWLRRTA